MSRERAAGEMDKRAVEKIGRFSRGRDRGRREDLREFEIRTGKGRGVTFIDLYSLTGALRERSLPLLDHERDRANSRLSLYIYIYMGLLYLKRATSLFSVEYECVIVIRSRPKVHRVSFGFE